ncbi:MAG: hypothetical protein JXR66_01060, partial [Bacteroidales bacterium]|nr:hypothetical protein [Bacteroidales bacterium]MBN2632114.1 hypothetical protein [Bacteroidales bacterium]
AALGDLGDGFWNMAASLPSALFILILVSFILGAFLRGGIFDALKSPVTRFTGASFFRACASNFWSFLVISLLCSLIIVFLALFVLALPFSLVRGMETQSGSGTAAVVIISGLIFLFLAAIMVMVADYARAWQVASEKKACFKALGFGFSRTFGTFLSSFSLIVLMIVIQLVVGFIILRILGVWNPDTGAAVFLFFIVSQLLNFLQTGIRVWRQGSVTALKEINDNKPAQRDDRNSEGL